MATFFWDEKGLLLLEFMLQRTTITGQNYANTITALREAIKEKRRGKLSAGMLMTMRQCICLQNLKLPFGNVGSNS